MQYISGIHALNLRCELDTCGDWHQSAIQWENITMRESVGSLWEDYGIEVDKEIPEHSGKYSTANHIRALLDLIEDGNFSLAQGMRKDFICVDKYNEEIFDKVYMLRNSSSWDRVSAFMGSEYYGLWLKYLKEKENKNEN